MLCRAVQGVGDRAWALVFRLALVPSKTPDEPRDHTVTPLSDTTVVPLLGMPSTRRPPPTPRPILRESLFEVVWLFRFGCREDRADPLAVV